MCLVINVPSHQHSSTLIPVGLLLTRHSNLNFTDYFDTESDHRTYISQNSIKNQKTNIVL